MAKNYKYIHWWEYLGSDMLFVINDQTTLNIQHEMLKNISK